MPKINLTNKPYTEQIRILKDYMARREQHKNQSPVTVEQICNKFKHNRLISDKAKYNYFDKLFRAAKGERVERH
ncbi:MAG: hypothetical protein ACM3O3_06775 [Syntrophothermus sp.]|nr:hypothetical protein [Ignavibacteriaceae bacterium]